VKARQRLAGFSIGRRSAASSVAARRFLAVASGGLQLTAGSFIWRPPRSSRPRPAATGRPAAARRNERTQRPSPANFCVYGLIRFSKTCKRRVLEFIRNDNAPADRSRPLHRCSQLHLRMPRRRMDRHVMGKTEKQGGCRPAAGHPPNRFSDGLCVDSCLSGPVSV